MLTRGKRCESHTVMKNVFHKILLQHYSHCSASVANLTWQHGMLAINSNYFYFLRRRTVHPEITNRSIYILLVCGTVVDLCFVTLFSYELLSFGNPCRDACIFQKKKTSIDIFLLAFGCIVATEAKYLQENEGKRC